MVVGTVVRVVGFTALGVGAGRVLGRGGRLRAGGGGRRRGHRACVVGGGAEAQALVQGAVASVNVTRFSDDAAAAGDTNATFYTVVVVGCNGERWEVQRRFSEFVTLCSTTKARL